MKRVLLLLLLPLMACQKHQSTTTGNPMVSLNMTSSQSSTAVAIMSFGEMLENFFFPKAVASAPPSMTDAASNTVTLDQGWMVIKEIEFEANEVPGADEVDGDKVEFVGPYVVDLFSATADTLGSAPVASTAIRRIKMKLHRLESALDNSPAELAGNSIYFHGTVGSKQFAFVSQEGTEFQVGGPTALNVRDSMNLLLSIRIVPIINKIDLTYLKNQDGPIVISDSNKYNAAPTSICPSIDASSTTIYDCFRKGLEQQANLGDDSDGSGEIETDESGVHDN